VAALIVRKDTMTEKISEHFRYLIKHPNNDPSDKTRFVIYSVNPMTDDRVQEVYEEFRNRVVHSPSQFTKFVVIYDDRPASVG
jgi:hypothetical protein